jgi:hypothetical protein
LLKVALNTKNQIKLQWSVVNHIGGVMVSIFCCVIKTHVYFWWLFILSRINQYTRCICFSIPHIPGQIDWKYQSEYLRNIFHWDKFMFFFNIKKMY